MNIHSKPRKSLNESPSGLASLRHWFDKTTLGGFFGHSTPALPVDLFRVVVGILAFFYFLGLWSESIDISSPMGVIDHWLVQDMFWFTRLGLFQAGYTDGMESLFYFTSMLACWPVILGFRPKLFTAFLYIVAVSSFRWNFIVAYVEDGIMHLMLFWLLLLPIGKTLVAGEFVRGPRNAWQRWLSVRVPGTVVGWFLMNIILIYLVAGITKLGSPMWRDGSAVFVILNLPVSRAPEFWTMDFLPFLKGLDWLAMVVEIMAPLAVILPPRHWGKYILLACGAGLHLGIVGTMRLPLANLACIGSWILIFSPEIMSLLRRGNKQEAVMLAQSRWCGRIAMVFIIILWLAMVRIPMADRIAKTPDTVMENAIDARAAGGLTQFHKPLYCILWLGGIAQQYRLMNWVDMRNHRFDYEIYEITPEGTTRFIDQADIFFDSNRAELLQMYLHDLGWAGVPENRRGELKRSLALGFAKRYCRSHQIKGYITVKSSIKRVDIHRPNWIERESQVLFCFCERNGQIEVSDSNEHLSMSQSAGGNR